MMNVMVFEGDGVEAAGDFVAFVFWRDEGRGFRSGAGIPAKEFLFCGIGDGSIGEFLADGVDLPDAGLVAELSAEPETVLTGAHSGGVVGRAADGHFGPGAGPFLIIEMRLLEADGIVELREEAARILREIDRRALMGDEALAVYFEFVLFGFAAEDGVIFEDEGGGVWPSVAREE